MGTAMRLIAAPEAGGNEDGDRTATIVIKKAQLCLCMVWAALHRPHRVRSNLRRFVMKRCLGCVVLCALGVILAAAPLMAGEKVFLTIASGPTGGDWYTMGGTIGELAKSAVPGATVTVTTGGAVGNLSVVDAGKADIGLSMASLYNEARSGSGEFQGKAKENIRAMAYLANIFMSFLLVAEESPIRSIDEIREKKIPIRLLTSTRASSPAVAAERMLGEYGIKLDDITKWGGKVGYVSYAEASNLIKDGHADAWVGPMVSGIVELATTKKMRLLPIRSAVLDAVQEKYQYVKATLPKGMYYFVTVDTPHMAESVILIARKGLADDVVYRLAKAISGDPEQIRRVSKTYQSYDPAQAWRNVGGPLHPGAERFYREASYMK
jgi:hypothetical protein